MPALPPSLRGPGLARFVAALLWLSAGSRLLAQTIVWNGADAGINVNTNWSDANNWTGGIPGPATNICFFNPGVSATQGVVNNVVDASRTILSLQYGNTNGFHTTQINPGAKLMISNNAGVYLVFAGNGSDNGASQTSYSKLLGAGTLSVVSTNPGSFFVVQQGSANNGSHNATLDLSGLATLNLNVGRLVVGGANPTSAGASNWLSGTLYLAGTNNLRVTGPAPAIDVGDCVANGGTSYLYLGQTNALFADSMTIAHSKATCTLSFNPALAGANPALSLSGNTNARVTTLAIGDFSAQSTSGSTTSGNANLAGGTVNAQVATCFVGHGQTGNGSGPTTGTLTVGPGRFDVNNLNVGFVSISSAAGSVTGTVNVTNGTLVVNSNLVLAYNAGATAATTGSLNLTNGTVLANAIVPGGGTSKLSLNGGLLSVTNTLGTPSAPLSSLTVNNGASLQFWVTNNFTNAVATAFSTDNSGIINIASLPIVLNYPSPFPLIFCANGSGTGTGFSLGALPGAYQGYISNDHSHTIWLVVTNGPPPPKLDRWAGAVNANWDTNTLNWTNNGVASAYREEDLILFDDSAQSSNVTLVGATPHTPYAWTVTNSLLSYTFGGTNSVSGAAKLTKSGSGSLTLAEDGDSFSGGMLVNAGTLILDEVGSVIAGGLTIAAGASVQVGNHDAKGGLPSGAITNNGALVFSQTITNLVSSAIAGSGSLTQQGTGTLTLSGSNTYTGSTFVLQGTLALTDSGSISRSANTAVNNATFDVSTVAGSVSLGNLSLTNATIDVGPTTVGVSSLNLGGVSNTLNVTALPGILVYPTNLTLIQAPSGINGHDLALGRLPAGSPAYSGSLGISGNAVVLALASGPLGAVTGTVSFSATNSGYVLNPAFCGLSYEKSQLTGHLFVSSNTSLVTMFGQIAPAVLRIGGNSVDTTCWGGLSNLTAITAAQVDAFAGFVKALPTNWLIIYGINMSVNTPANCAAEATYAANALGSSLLGFEIGNETDLYAGNGIRSSSYTYAQFRSEWQALAAAITNAVPGWAITNAGHGWTLTGPAAAYNTSGYTEPFASNEKGVISMVTQHYYRANGQSPTSTLELLLQPDANVPATVSGISAAAASAKLPLGFRMAECGSFYNGGAPNVSDAYGTALWAVDFLFTLALNGCQGLNFHGGGGGTGYTPIADNGSAVVQARPEFYGLKLLSLVSQGSAVPATVSLASNINFTAYGVRRANNGITAVLNNKETNEYVKVAVNLGTNASAAQWMALTGTDLNGTNGYTIGGAAINADGSWLGGIEGVLAATNGQLTVIVPPITALVLNPVVLPRTGTNLILNVTGNSLDLEWPSNYVGWLLQSNDLSLTTTNGWFTVPGSSSTNHVPIAIDPTRTNVFYRMAHP